MFGEKVFLKKENMKTIDFQGFFCQKYWSVNLYLFLSVACVRNMWNDVFTGGKSTESLIYPMVKTIV